MKIVSTCLMLFGVSIFLLSGCAMVQTPVNGLLVTSLTAPITATDNQVSSKVGNASCTSILGIVAFGDCSINAAARNGNISKIHHVDHGATSVLGIYSSFETHVYGE
jgi:hypothetical protein